MLDPWRCHPLRLELPIDGLNPPGSLTLTGELRPARSCLVIFTLKGVTPDELIIDFLEVVSSVFKVRDWSGRDEIALAK